MWNSQFGRYFSRAAGGGRDSTAPRHAPIVLVDGGTAKATICLMGPRSTALNGTVGNLQSFVKQVTGVELKIVENKITTPAIVIGDCDLAKSHGLQGKLLPVEGF